MNAPEATVPPTGSSPRSWADRLQWLGRRGVVVVLLGIGVLWLHELTVGLDERPAWKLKVMFVLIPLGVASAIAQSIAWVVPRLSRRQKN